MLLPFFPLKLLLYNKFKNTSLLSQRRQIYALALGSSFLLSHPHDSVLNSDLSESRANALLCGGATWGFPRQWEAPSLGDPHAGGGAASH